MTVVLVAQVNMVSRVARCSHGVDITPEGIQGDVPGGWVPVLH